MRILITGGKGMLGRTLVRHLSEHELCLVDLPEVDVTDLAGLDEAVGPFAPEVILHAAAATDVDRCETEPDWAYRVNAVGSANMAVVCHRLGVRLIAVSTDYVFDGRLERPYHEWDRPRPQTVYGASKLAGEEAVRRHCPDHAIVRLGWLYGPGGPSFVHAMLRLGREEGPPLDVVDDQIGNPTSTDAATEALVRLVQMPVVGTFHATCEGEATWCEFAKEILRTAGLRRPIAPCTSDRFPRPARRPANSRLEKRNFRLLGFPAMPTWRESLKRFLEEYPEG